MHFKSYLFILLTGLFAFQLSAQQDLPDIYHDTWIDFNKNGEKDIYEDPTQEVEKRVEDLLSQMTLEEKTCQMTTLYGFGRVLKDELPTPEWKDEIWVDGIGNIDEQLNYTTFREKTKTDLSFPYSKHTRAIHTIQRWFIEETRLGIPVDFTNEGIRGLAHDRATCFPANIGMGATWDQNLAREMGRIIGEEAKVLGYSNVYAPILDISRDPRWGRTVETYSEDPFLVGAMGVNIVKGIQSNGIVSTAKHFAVYSAPKGGRDGEARTDPHITLREVHNLYLYPFRRAFREGKAKGTMASYNDYDGIPIAASHYFLTDILRDSYGFDGYVVSDSDAVEYVENKHRVAEDYESAVSQCAAAGLNIRTNFSPPEVYTIPLRNAVKDGKLSIDTIDARVREILKVKFWLGLFDAPLHQNPDEADQVVRMPEHLEKARQASYESLVLLKNENSTLPLNKADFKKILVAGPNVKAVKHSMSRYGPNHVNIISIWEGLTKKFPEGIEWDFAEGCTLQPENWEAIELYNEEPGEDEKTLIAEAVEKAKQSDLAIVVLGDDPETVGESLSRTTLNLPGYQETLLRAIHATGTPTVLVLMNGRPASINWADKNIDAILEAWFPGEFGGYAVADALFGDYNPGGKLPITFPRTVGQIPLNFPYKPGSQAAQGPENHTRVLEPLYVFGHGLSYTEFAYDDLNITPSNPVIGDTLTVSCKVSNTGAVAGDEVVQLYFHDLVSSVTVYESQLRGFQRIHLEPGESATLTFELSPEDVSLIDRDMNRVVEAGEIGIHIGSSSTDIRLEKTINLLPTPKESSLILESIPLPN